MLFRPRYHGFSAAMACLGLLASAASAAVTVFDFEDQAATFTSPPDTIRTGALTSLSMAKNGLTLTVTRDSGRAFDIVANTGNQAQKPADWGERSLDPFFSETPVDALVGTFNAPVSSVSIEFGDYGQDSDGFTLQVFDGPDGSGALLGTNMVPYGNSALPIFGTGYLAAAGIRSIRFTGGSPEFPNSVFYDNIQVSHEAPADAIPEAGSMTLLPGALPMLGLLRRRAR